MRASNLPEPEPTLDNFSAICKECGAGTLNNRAIPLFKEWRDFDGYEVQIGLECLRCHSIEVQIVEL